MLRKKIIPVLLVGLFLLSFSSWRQAFADGSNGDINGDGYNDNDFNKMQAFLIQPSAESGKSNGQQIQAYFFDPNKPATWKGVVWNGETPKRILSIGTVYSWSDKLAGTLDVSGCTALTNLDCSFSQIGALDASGCTALTNLNCSGNQIAALDVSGCTALESLSCQDNYKITALDVSENTKLTYLCCFRNQISSLDVNANTALNHLMCGVNPIATLDVSANTALTYLECGFMPITTLDISKNTALEYLDCSYDQISVLDVSANTALRDFYCNNNHLAMLNVSQHNTLSSLDCSNNKITTLEIGTALEVLNASYNQIATLDISGCTVLSDLYCSSNQIATLDVSGKNALRSLDCSNNKIATLDLSSNPKLVYLDCSNNKIAALDLSANTALFSLFCNNNQLVFIHAMIADDNNEHAATDIRLRANGHGYVELRSEYGNSIFVNACPASGSLFKNWTSSGTQVSTDTSFELSAGNSYDLEAIFEPDIKYNFTGFFQPVEMNGVLNIAKAGSAIPIKFSLGGDMGLDVFEAGYPKAISCNELPGQQTNDVETVTVANNGLSYDPLTDQYTYVWKTDKTWAGLSKQFVIKFLDGTEQVACFKFK